MADLLGKIRRGLKKPPRYIIKRLFDEVRIIVDRLLSPHRARHLTINRLTSKFACSSVDELWESMGSRAYPGYFGPELPQVSSIMPGEDTRILRAAERAMQHKVDLLGSGVVELGDEIDWLRDYKTGHRWEPRYCRWIEYGNLDQPSDVKFPWELSRMQWLIPLGQAYMLTHEEKYATKCREIIFHWIDTNPYAFTVNWSCTMDVALRAIVWTWLFHVFHKSESWNRASDRFKFLKSLYLHGGFTLRNLEESDVNGNHFTADAAGLVFLGLFFRGEAEADKWTQTGWEILCKEIRLQTHADGVNFESSIAYHRLVQELFLYPAMYRGRLGLDVPEHYRECLCAMAEYTAAYSRSDGSVPLWGDADDARTLPFGAQGINDHRYLLAIVGIEFGVSSLLQKFSGSVSEIFWLFGPEVLVELDRIDSDSRERQSVQFPDGGFYVLQNRDDHVFVDCGPLGLAGRGGHGHNDLLSFEAFLDGQWLISDCGAYQYTGNFVERNRFRSTAYHNTPMIDGEEINRFQRPDYLWTLHNDARHDVRNVEFTARADVLSIAHDGYRRLEFPVTVARTLELEHEHHVLRIRDEFEGTGKHNVRVPVHLATGVEVASLTPGRVSLAKGGKQFALTWDNSDDWSFSVEQGRISPSFGVANETSILVWLREGVLRPLSITVRPDPQATVVSDSLPTS